MSFTSIANQPIIFHSQDEIQSLCEECGNSDYKQLIDFNDQIFFQVESTPCEQYGMTPFEDELVGWTSDDGIICGNGILAGSYSQSFYIDFDYKLFSVTFTILNIDEGAINVRMFGSSTHTLTLAGTYTLYFSNPTIIDFVYVQLIFESTSTFKGCFNALNIDIKGIATGNQMKVGIVDAITLETIDVIQPLYTLKDNKVTAAFDLTDVEVNEGCYRLAIADFCDNTCSQFTIQNPLFNLLFGSLYRWTTTIGAETTLSVSQNLVCFETDGADGEGELVSASELCEGKYYYVSIFVESVSNTAIYAQVGNSSVQFPLNTTGYLTIPITAGTPSITNEMKLVLYFQNTGAGLGEACITRVDVQIDDSDIQWNQYSDVLAIGDYNDSCKYYKIEGCNAQDQFNLAFGGSSFLPMIRLEGKRAKAQYVTNANTFRYASGQWSANYVNRLKQWTYYFGRLPEYVLDFLSTIFYYDNCYVNGVLMFPQDNAFPTIDWSDADTYLGSFAIDLIEKENKVIKVQCGSSDANCLPSILDNSEEPFLLTQDLNRITTQDSVNLYYENNL